MTAARCRVGDMAFIVGESATPENLGRLVRVLRLARADMMEFSEGDPHARGPIWFVESLGGTLSLCLSPSNRVDQRRCRAYPDRWLLPLRGVEGTKGRRRATRPATSPQAKATVVPSKSLTLSAQGMSASPPAGLTLPASCCHWTQLAERQQGAQSRNQLAIGRS